MRLFQPISTILAFSLAGWGQTYRIQTIAGVELPPEPAPATSVSVRNLNGVAVDLNGNVYFSTIQSCVYKVDPSGILTRIAGTGRAGFSGDGGSAREAQLNNQFGIIASPFGLAVDNSGNLYIADSGNSRIRKVDPGGIITTVAGNGGSGFSGDGGRAVDATLYFPSGVAVDTSGNLFVADTTNSRIRKIDTRGIITTVAGGGAQGDGSPAAQAQLSFPHGVAVDARGNLYIADTSSNRIRKVDTNGMISTLAGSLNVGYSGDGGPAVNAQLALPAGVAVDASGNVYIADTNSGHVRKVTTDGTIHTVAGDPKAQYRGEAPEQLSPESPLRGSPAAVALDAFGNLYIAEFDLMKLSPDGVFTRVTGNGQVSYSGDGGQATRAQIAPVGVAIIPAGDLLLAEPFNQRVRRIDRAGTVSTLAGTGEAGYSGDGGPAAAAQLNRPRSVAVDSAGNVYVADSGNNAVRKIDPAGTISTVTKTDSTPYSVAVDLANNLYIGFSGRVDRRTPAGATTTVASSGTGRAFYTVLGLGVDRAGTLYIADGVSVTIIDSNGGIENVSGISYPNGVALDPRGNLYISSSNQIARRTPDGSIESIADAGKNLDGTPVPDAQFVGPQGLAVDRAGNVYVSDSNYTLRRLTPSSPLPPIRLPR